MVERPGRIGKVEGPSPSRSTKEAVRTILLRTDTEFTLKQQTFYFAENFSGTDWLENLWQCNQTRYIAT